MSIKKTITFLVVSVAAYSCIANAETGSHVSLACDVTYEITKEENGNKTNDRQTAVTTYSVNYIEGVVVDANGFSHPAKITSDLITFSSSATTGSDKTQKDDLELSLVVDGTINRVNGGVNERRFVGVKNSAADVKALYISKGVCKKKEAQF